MRKDSKCQTARGAFGASAHAVPSGSTSPYNKEDESHPKGTTRSAGSFFAFCPFLLRTTTKIAYIRSYILTHPSQTVKSDKRILSDDFYLLFTLISVRRFLFFPDLNNSFAHASGRFIFGKLLCQCILHFDQGFCLFYHLFYTISSRCQLGLLFPNFSTKLPVHKCPCFFVQVAQK